MLRFDIITIFPTMFASVLNDSIVGRAQAKKKISIGVHNLWDFTTDPYRQVDDRPFGGGPGMVLMCEPIFRAVEKIRGRKKQARVILLCPTGKTLTQALAKKLAKRKHLILICGHYEGVDERVREKLVDESISIGDYVLTGGELPAMVLVDCLSRLVPGVLGRRESLLCESFESNQLEYPQYTRPANFHGMKIPNVLLSGHHQQIETWRKQQSLARTKKLRPDLLKIPLNQSNSQRFKKTRG